MKNARKEKFITRNEHNSENLYKPISNTVSKSNLSLPAKGLLLVVLSMADDYKFHPTHFYKHYPRRTVDAAVAELVEKGYCKKVSINRKTVYYYFIEAPDDVQYVHHNSKDDVQNEHLCCTERTSYDVQKSQYDVQGVHLISNLISKGNNTTTISNNNTVEENMEQSKIDLHDTIEKMREEFLSIIEKDNWLELPEDFRKKYFGLEDRFIQIFIPDYSERNNIPERPLNEWVQDDVAMNEYKRRLHKSLLSSFWKKEEEVPAQPPAAPITQIKRKISIKEKELLKSEIEIHIGRYPAQFDGWYEFMVKVNPENESRPIESWAKSYETKSGGAEEDKLIMVREEEARRKKILANQNPWNQMRKPDAAQWEAEKLEKRKAEIAKKQNQPTLIDQYDNMLRSFSIL